VALEQALRGFGTYLGDADIAFGNLETPVSDLGLAQSRRSRQLRGNPEYAAALRAAGLTVVNVANNHALEHGAALFQDSVSRLEEQGIQVCGRRGSSGWHAQPVIREVKAMRIGILGYSLRPTLAASADLPHAEPTDAELLADVARLRSQVDGVLVSLHWGEEFVQHPAASEVRLAHQIVDAGAAVVLGHHPHVTRAVERYHGGVIAYSLGNFAADMIWHEPLRRGLALVCELSPEGVKHVEVHQTYVDGTFLPKLVANGSVTVREGGAVTGLPPDEYQRAARDTVREQRRSLYLYTLRNVWRYHPGMLLELATSTVRGKVARMVRRERNPIWG
jgi:poly-gamma-glutamate synthesis protein (capsule biosynthesis protein)